PLAAASACSPPTPSLTRSTRGRRPSPSSEPRATSPSDRPRAERPAQQPSLRPPRALPPCGAGPKEDPGRASSTTSLLQRSSPAPRTVMDEVYPSDEGASL